MRVMPEDPESGPYYGACKKFWGNNLNKFQIVHT